MAGLKTGHYKGALRRLRKAPLERRSGHRRDAAEVLLLLDDQGQLGRGGRAAGGCGDRDGIGARGRSGDRGRRRGAGTSASAPTEKRSRYDRHQHEAGRERYASYTQASRRALCRGQQGDDQQERAQHGEWQHLDRGWRLHPGCRFGLRGKHPAGGGGDGHADGSGCSGGHCDARRSGACRGRRSASASEAYGGVLVGADLQHVGGGRAGGYGCRG